jgi:hypothetical protein
VNIDEVEVIVLSDHIVSKFCPHKMLDDYLVKGIWIVKKKKTIRAIP